jgi:hypothetical protein
VCERRIKECRINFRLSVCFQLNYLIIEITGWFNLLGLKCLAFSL